jgi:hypothetical protein
MKVLLAAAALLMHTLFALCVDLSTDPGLKSYFIPFPCSE